MIPYLRNGVFLSIALAILIGILLYARQQFLKDALLEHETIEKPRAAMPLKEFGSLRIRLPEEDNFLLMSESAPNGSMQRNDNWILSDDIRQFLMMFSDVELTDKNVKVEIKEELNSMIAASVKDLEQTGSRFYSKGNVLMFEGTYEVGLFHKRILACGEFRSPLARLFLFVAPAAQSALQDSIMNSIEFKWSTLKYPSKQ